MADEAEELIDELALRASLEDLDLPLLLGAAIQALYDGVGRWMGDTLDEGKWSIHPAEGSGRLGTMIPTPRLAGLRPRRHRRAGTC